MDIGKAVSEVVGIVEKVSKTKLPSSVTNLASHIRGFVPTGSDLLDIITHGGYPIGRLTEIYGIDGIGKSSLLYMAMAVVQSMGGVCIFNDIENKFDYSNARLLGVDTSKVILLGSKIEQKTKKEKKYLVIEDYFSTLYDTIVELHERKFLPVVGIFMDSIACAWTQEDSNRLAEGDKPQMGSVARSVSTFLRSDFLNYLGTLNAFMIMTNQECANIGSFAGEKLTTPAGWKLRYLATLRINAEFDYEGKAIIVNKKQIGHKIKFFVKKCNYGIPHRKITVPFIYGRGIDNEMSIINQLILTGVLKKKPGGYIEFNGENKQQAELEQLLRDDSELKLKVLSEIKHNLF